MKTTPSQDFLPAGGDGMPAAEDAERAPFIPPHIAWPAAIIGLLLLGMTATFGVLMASKSDGGPSIVANYYAKAVAFDSLAVLHGKVEALGWTVAVDLEPADDAALRPVRFRITDAEFSPVVGLEGTVRAYRPSAVEAVATVSLAATGPGEYEALLPMTTQGLWDVELEGTWTTHTLIHRVRKEVW